MRDLIRQWTTDPGVKLVAHNAAFERICFSRSLAMPVGQYLPPEQWFDTMAVAALHGYPRSLEALAKALRLTPKDSAGTRLINLFSKPYRGKRVYADQKPEQWEEFREYCRQDVLTMREARHAMPGWPKDGFERDLWYVDQRINDRGMRVDLDLARGAVTVAKRNTEQFEQEVIEITGVDNPGSTAQLGRWCEDQGFTLPNWQKESVAEARLNSQIPPHIDRVLELRQELALVAHRKFEAAMRGVSMDGRLRGQFMYHAAHTGRWSSRGVQVHNLARLAFEYKDEEGEKHYDDLLEDLVLYLITREGDASPEDLKKSVRPMFLLDGVSSDFSAIEARVLAWLAGEDWVLEAFIEGRDLYVETADRMGGGMGRPEGKIAVLAAGYQGSVGSFRNMGYGGRRCPLDLTKALPKKGSCEDFAATDRVYSEFLHQYGGSEQVNVTAVERFYRTARGRLGEDALLLSLHRHMDEKRRDPNHKCDIEIREIVTAWRDANPAIRQFWYDLERVFWTGGGLGLIRVEKRGEGARFVFLPSGRVLKYYGVHKRAVRKNDPETGEEIPETKQQLYYRHIQGYSEKTYGGRLTENVTQAVARDLLADALLRLHRAGYPIVGHVHDEALIESDDAEGIRAIMRTGPSWAKGLPLDASATYLERYRKD
jgi:hypothetical protein